MKRFFKKLFKRGDFMTRADKAYYGHKFKTMFWSVFSLFIISWVGTNLVLCALTTNVQSNWDIIYEAPKDVVLPTGKSFQSTYKTEFPNAENIVFDHYTSANEYLVNKFNVIADATKKQLIGEQSSVDYYVCNSGKDVYILSNSNMLANTDCSYMFDGYDNYSLMDHLQTIKFNNFDTSNVENMHAFFQGGYALKKIEGLENWDTSKVTDMGNMFCFGESMNALTSCEFDPSNFNTENVKDMTAMFRACGLKTIDVSKYITRNVTRMNSMFCSEETEEIIGLENFDTSNVEDMSYMFYCSSVNVLDLSSFNTSKVTDMSAMFYSCRNLSTIYASSSFVTTKVTSSSNMFYRCEKLNGYNANYVDKTYARINKTGQKGYFTAK